jgi:hypothetical protein
MTDEYKKLTYKGKKITKDNPVPIKEDEPSHRCAGCGKIIKERYYLNSSSLLNKKTGKLPWCTFCLNEFFAYQYRRLNNCTPSFPVDISTVEANKMDQPLSYCCMILDLCCSKRAVETFKGWLTDAQKKVDEGGAKGQSAAFIGRYNQILWRVCSEQANKMTYADSDIQFVNMKDYGLTIDDIDDDTLRDLRIKWGDGFEAIEYLKMQNMMSDLEITYEFENSPIMEQYLMSYCKAQIQSDKLLSEGNNTAWVKNQEIIAKICEKAGINPNQERGNNAPEQQSFGCFIKKIEDEEPIGEALPELQDVDHIMWYFTVCFIGPICKLLGRKNNRYYKAYEEFEKKYKIQTDFDINLDEKNFIDLDDSVNENFNDGES